jgi:hypothetical protein
MLEVLHDQPVGMPQPAPPGVRGDKALAHLHGAPDQREADGRIETGHDEGGDGDPRVLGPRGVHLGRVQSQEEEPPIATIRMPASDRSMS